MKHLIIGTAGHIDHGKTALVKALTGIDCDTYKEEKRRGITINLGFAHLDLLSGLSLGIVDVPGHKDFVHTMVSGACGIDLAMLVVAADAGVMPQTREHLQILDVLNVKSGLVAVTKTDLVEQEIVVMAKEEIRELLTGTFLADCPVVSVSSVTGEGLDELKKAIETVASEAPERPRGEVFRVFVDRIFSVSGFGTVVTGSVVSGSLHTGDTAYLLPGIAKELRVRRLERHGTEVDEVAAGERASINLVGLNRKEFRRGMTVCDRVLRATTMVDARLRLFQHAQEFKLWNQALFHVGTFEDSGRVHLIDKDHVAGGETALVQIHLSRPCVIRHGDRFVLRSSSSEFTWGGGEVIDAAPLHHRRRPPKLIQDLTRVAEGDLPELIVSEVKKRFGAISHLEIAESLNIAPDEVLKITSRSLSDDILSYSFEDGAYLIVRIRHDELRKQVLKKIAAFHRRHPLVEEGRMTEELLGILGIPRESSGEGLVRLMLERMKEDRELKKVGRTWALSDHSAQIGPAMQRNIEFIEDFLRSCRMHTPLMSELTVQTSQRKMDMHEVNQILRHLVSGGKAYFVDGEYIHASIVDRCRGMLLQELDRRGQGVTVAEFRDLIKGNRKICLLLLAIYDGEGSTGRQGDLRVLTDKGHEMLAEAPTH